MIIGIDLGTTNSLVGVYQDGQVKLIPNAFGEYLTPSVVALDDNDEIIVGKIAKERLVTHPDKTVSQFKRFMGTKHELTLGNRAYKAEELSSFIIRKLVDDAETYLGEKVEEVIVSVPAYFNDAQRYATKLAGKFAGVQIDRMIARGCALLAGIKERQGEIRDLLLSDICPFTLGIEIVGDRFSPIIERNSTLPASRIEQYYTAELGQSQVKIKVYQGEMMKASQNLFLGELEVPVPVNTRVNESFTVRFTYDLNGILDVEVKIDSTQEVFSHVILQDSITLTEKEIKAKQAELTRYKINAQETEVYRFLIEKANRVYSMLLGRRRDELMAETRRFEEEVSQASVYHLPKLYQSFSNYLDFLERGL